MADLASLFGGGDEDFISIQESPGTRRRNESESSATKSSRPKRPAHLFPKFSGTDSSRRYVRERECLRTTIETGPRLVGAYGGGGTPRLRNSFSCSNLQNRGFTPTCAQMPSVLPPEIEEGNIEYKRQLVNLTQERFEHLVTQLKWRLTEGNGEAIYELGVDDNGHVVGLGADELAQTLTTLKRMAKRLGATTDVLRERCVENGKRKALEVLVQKMPNSQMVADIRVAVLGNVDSGKSTLLGVLTQGELDNGRGRSRLNLFRHLHEVESGRTSSISCEVLGFDPSGAPVNYSGNRTIEDIVAESGRLVVLIDLAGHHKYQRITLYGLTSYMPHYVVLVVSATTGMVGTSRDHCHLALALNVPLIVVISKVDLASPEVTIAQVEDWLRSLRLPLKFFRVTNQTEADAAAATLHTDRVTPVIGVSCVTGSGVNLLTRLLGQLPSAPNSQERACLLQAPAEFWADEVYDLPCVEGVVLMGLVHSGVVHQGDRLRLGPLKDGSYIWVRVSSLHRNRLPHRSVQAGQTASVAVVPASETGEEDYTGLPMLNDVEEEEAVDEGTSTLSRRSIEDLLPIARRGSVLLGGAMASPPPACWKLLASVHLITGDNSGGGPNELPNSFQTVLLCGNVCQTVEAKRLLADEVETSAYRNNPGGTLVRLRFLKHPELVREGSTLFCRGNSHSGSGSVLRVFPIDDPSEP